jgi:hypothetical protein
MKKTISIILTVVMLLGVFSFGNVFAVNPTLTLGVPAQVEITVGGDVRSFDFTPSESGYYSFCSITSDPSADTKAELYKGGTFFASNDDSSDNNYNFRIIAELTASVTYTLNTRFYNDDTVGDFEVVVEKFAAQGISYEPVATVTAYANTDYYPDMTGDKVIVTLADSTERIYTVQSRSYSLYLYDEQGQPYGGEYGQFSASPSSSTWALGDSSAEITVCLGPFVDTAPVTVIEDPKGIADLEVTVPSGKRIEVIENVSGYESGGDFYYQFNPVAGTTATVKYADGTESTFTYEANGSFLNEEGYDFGYEGTWYCAAPWSKNDNNEAVFEYRGVTDKVPAYVIDNPISDFTFTQGRDIYENTNGYFDTDDNSEDYFYYNYYGDEIGAKVTLKYKDGKSVTYTQSTIPPYGSTEFIDENGNQLPYGLDCWVYSDQYHNHWTVGSDNAATACLSNWKMETKITILPNNTKSVELVLAGEWTLEGDATPLLEHEGNQLIVTNKDNSKTVYTKKWDSKNYGFRYFGADGKALDFSEYSVWDGMDEQGAYILAQFRGVNSDKVRVDYRQIPGVANIKFSPIAPIVLPENQGTVTKTGNCVYDYDACKDQLFADGGVMIVTYGDGSVKKYTTYCKDNYYWLVGSDGSSIDYSFFSYYNTCNQVVRPWTTSEPGSLTIEYRGVKCEVPVRISLDTPGEYPGFPDVPENAWFYDAVKYCATRGFITGYKNGNFGPADALQRQDFVVILARIAGADVSGYTSCKLTDVDMNSYYGKAVAWAVDQKIIGGYENGKFGVGDKITREQVATILYRYMHSPDKGDAAAIAGFADKGKISAFATDAMIWAVNFGVISGKNATTLAPTATASRAEIATIIMRMDQNGMF